jgi:hypothetical protein
MIPFEPFVDKRYPKSLDGLREFAFDFMNTRPSDERIAPPWPLDLLCGLSLLTPPFFAFVI